MKNWTIKLPKTGKTISVIKMPNNSWGIMQDGGYKDTLVYKPHSMCNTFLIGFSPCGNCPCWNEEVPEYFRVLPVTVTLIAKKMEDTDVEPN